MPKEMEDALKRKAKKKGLKGKRANAYVYGTMRKTGWKPKGEGKAKDQAMGLV
jgi:hypothetical protein